MEVEESLLDSLLFPQVIDESLRLGGIAIWLMREAKQDVEYQGPSLLISNSNLACIHLI